jgi:N-acetylglutamate synthase-like GNAT family acetyltransferase
MQQRTWQAVGRVPSAAVEQAWSRINLVRLVTIRPATEADQPTIRRMVREAGINPMNLRWPNFLVAEESGAVLGIGQVKTHGDGSRELASMVVVPGRRGQGIGAALIERLIALHPDTALHLTCRKDLVGYYERFGFRRVAVSEWTPFFRRLIPVVNLFARLFGAEIVVMRRDA